MPMTYRLILSQQKFDSMPMAYSLLFKQRFDSVTMASKYIASVLSRHLIKGQCPQRQVLIHWQWPEQRFSDNVLYTKSQSRGLFQYQYPEVFHLSIQQRFLTLYAFMAYRTRRYSWFKNQYIILLCMGA